MSGSCSRRPARWTGPLLGSAVLLTSLSLAPTAGAAGGVVGTASCMEAPFGGVFFAAPSPARGTIAFNCSVSPHTIIFSTVKQVLAETEIRRVAAPRPRVSLPGDMPQLKITQGGWGGHCLPNHVDCSLLPDRTKR